MKQQIARLVPKRLLTQHRLNKQRRIYERYRSLDPSEYRRELGRWFTETTGENLDLENPSTFNQKVQWLKLYDCTPRKGELADKYEMRAYVEAVLGPEHLAPLLGCWRSFEEIDFASLPDQYVLKATLGSGTNLFVTRESPLDPNRARDLVNGWLATDYRFVNGFELHYGFTTNKIIAEELLDFGPEGPVDYRFFCSYGDVFSIWCDTGSASHDYHRTIFTPDWHPLTDRATHPLHEAPPEKPASFEYMLDAARQLSANFSLVRVDFYEYGDHVLVGELTFTPQSGAAVFDPPEFNLTMGGGISMPESKMPYKGLML